MRSVVAVACALAVGISGCGSRTPPATKPSPDALAGKHVRIVMPDPIDTERRVAFTMWVTRVEDDHAVGTIVREWREAESGEWMARAPPEGESRIALATAERIEIVEKPEEGPGPLAHKMQNVGTACLLFGPVLCLGALFGVPLRPDRRPR